MMKQIKHSVQPHPIMQPEKTNQINFNVNAIDIVSKSK